ncbi:MAG: hypothetical protein V1767_01055 [Chloroflexota bacterium]
MFSIATLLIQNINNQYQLGMMVLMPQFGQLVFVPIISVSDINELPDAVSELIDSITNLVNLNCDKPTQIPDYLKKAFGE